MGLLEELATKRQAEVNIAGVATNMMNLIGSDASAVLAGIGAGGKKKKKKKKE